MAINLFSVHLSTLELSRMQETARREALGAMPPTIEESQLAFRDISKCRFTIRSTWDGKMIRGDWQFTRYGLPQRGDQIAVMVDGWRCLYRVVRSTMESNGVHGTVWTDFIRCMD